ncbi:acyltransferase family protein [Bacteroides fluxus]|uniref:Acyltransferase n=1 Tax=Bacteroides fluxus YIT 12057 TaxID=763034 RepID=F3PVV4_9BACE|nr:acyltransferase [Bacteroides fluxus]EGF53276.1 acyltransferase [Bacteroides fluxus YIT 12057]
MNTYIDIKEESNYVNFLRILLIIGVVFTHSAVDVPLPHGYSNYAYNIIFFQQEVLGEFRVPTFFFLSGYFFFKKENLKFNLSDYKIKIKKRVTTLLIPYIIWCLIALLLKMGYIFLKTGNLSTLNGIIPIAKSFIFYNGTIIYPFPINGPLWYIRDLIIITLFSPIIFWTIQLVRKKYIIVSILLVIFIILPYLQIPLTLLYTGLIWFCIGASLSISQKNILSSLPSQYIYIIYPILVCINVLLRENIMHHFFMQITIIGGVLFILRFSWWIYKKCNIQKCNSGSIVMFIYCSHFIVDYVKPVYINFFSNSHLILAHFMIGITTLLICSLAYMILNKYLHNSLRFLIGNR